MPQRCYHYRILSGLQDARRLVHSADLCQEPGRVTLGMLRHVSTDILKPCIAPGVHFRSIRVDLSAPVIQPTSITTLLSVVCSSSWMCLTHGRSPACLQCHLYHCLKAHVELGQGCLSGSCCTGCQNRSPPEAGDKLAVQHAHLGHVQLPQVRVHQGLSEALLICFYAQLLAQPPGRCLIRYCKQGLGMPHDHGSRTWLPLIRSGAHQWCAGQQREGRCALHVAAVERTAL